MSTPDPELSPEQLGLLRRIASDPRGWHPLYDPAPGWKLRGLVTMEPPKPSPFESRWRGNPNPWRATITPRGRRILLEQAPRIRPLAYDVELE